MLTKDEAMAVLARIIAENPDNVNPIGNFGTCGYYQTDSSGNTTRCLVGQMAHELGWPKPSSEDGSAIELFWADELETNVWAGLADEDCANYLYGIQLRADGTGPAGSNPIPWKDVVL